MSSFQNLRLPGDLPDLLEKIQFTTPTPIQEKAIPLALEGRDILGSAQTGTGKTGAFVVPLIAYLMDSQDKTALILTPTRELALQVMQFVNKLLGAKSYIKTALLIGGESMPKQFKQLQGHPRLIVGTPGRVNDHLKRRSLNLSKAHFLVLDEMDRMLDIGFGVQIDAIIKFLPQERQTLMFSATLPKSIENLTSKYLKNPERIAIGSTLSIAQNIQQEILHVSMDEKYPGLIKELEKREGSILVFVKTKRGAEKLSKRLSYEEHSSDFLHGSLSQNQRERVVRAFSKNKSRILVATDIAARGLDIPALEHVINYDLPQCAEDFIHRLGRTGRAGAHGSAITFIDPENRRSWKAIQRLLNPGAVEEERPRSSSPSNGRKRFASGGRRFNSDNRFGSDKRSSSENRFGSDKRSGSENRFGSDRRASSENRFGSDKRSGSENRFGSDKRSGSENRFGSDKRSSSENRFGSDKRSGSDNRFGSDKRSGSENRFGSDKRSGSDNRFGSDKSFGSDNRFGSDKRSGSDNRFGSDKSFGSDNRFGSDKRSGSDNRFGSDKRSGSDNRFGSDKRSGSDNRFGSDKRSGSDNRFGSDKRSSSENRFGSDNKQPAFKKKKSNFKKPFNKSKD